MQELNTAASGPGVNRVRAWVHTILNPVIDCLRREQYLLAKGNLSWRLYSQKCEFIRPISEYVDFRQQPNLEDFFQDPTNQAVSRDVPKHDELVSRVELAASDFFEKLMHSSPFAREIEGRLSEYRKRSQGNPLYPNSAVIENHLAKYVAEYLVNKTISLPDHYATHKFWEDFRPHFQDVAKDFEPYLERESYRKVSDARTQLKSASQSLLDGFEAHRYFLCSKFDIEAAPVGPISDSNWMLGTDAIGNR